MKVNKSLYVLAALALVVAIGVAVMVFAWHRNPPRQEGTGGEGGRNERHVSDGRGKEQPDREPVAELNPAHNVGQAVEAPASNVDDGTSVAQLPDSNPDPADVEHALVESFDNATDKWTNPTDGEISMKDVYAFADAFSRVPTKYKHESLQRALNLIPDDNIMILAGLLMDKSLDNEYIVAVFQDVLNRSDEVKQPLLNEIYKDKTHPCWPEVAWIFDATGQKDNKNIK